MPIRALHQIFDDQHDDVPFVHYAQRVRNERGCVEAESYRSLSTAAAVSIVELWENEDAYGEHWARELEQRDGSLLQWPAGPEGRAPSEFYAHQYFAPGAVWIPVERVERESAIKWPARGGVRIIIQGSMSDVSAAVPGLLANAAETMREPGCTQFDWSTGMEFEGDLLLTEIWADQVVYDAHWNLRMKTSGGRAEMPPSVRKLGSDGLEFYRHQQFDHLYDRWLPSDIAGRSETIVWPS